MSATNFKKKGCLNYNIGIEVSKISMEQKNKKALVAGLILAGVALIIILGTTMPMAVGAVAVNSPRITAQSPLDRTSSGSVLSANAALKDARSINLDRGDIVVRGRGGLCRKHPRSKHCR